MHQTGNFNPEWGYLAPAPSLLRSVRLVVVAATIAATTSAVVAVALVRQPAAEESVAARTLVLSPDAPSALPPVADLRVQPDHVAMAAAEHAIGASQRQSALSVAATAASTAGASRITSAPQREAIAARSETAKPVVVAPAGKATPSTATVAATEVASAPKSPENVKTPGAARRATRVEASTADTSRLRIASAQRSGKPTAQPSEHNDVRNTLAANRDNKARDDESLLTRTVGVTDHVIAATQRAVSTIGVIPSWIGSIGNRLGG
jgi:hypothetical protein